MENTDKKLTRVIAAILTVAFLGFVFTAFGAMLLESGTEIYDSTRLMSQLKAYLPADWNQFDLLQARISSFTSTVADKMWLKEDMGYVNSGFQYGLGKRLINTGSQNMLTLTTGHLYDLQPDRDLSGALAEIVDLRNGQLADKPFLFVYEHPTLYDDAMMPAGYGALDHSADLAETVVGTLTDAGIDVMDSREVLNASGVPLNDLLLVTDQHWSTRAAITMAQAIAERLNAMTGAALDPSLLDMDNLNTLVHEKLFMGKYGQRVGTRFVTPDDIIEYWPKYDTSLSRHTLLTTTKEDASGDFRTVATRFDRLEPDPGRTWNKLAYTYYGQVEAYNIFENENAPDTTILLLKDSYSAPIGTFLSLLAKNVVCVDLRKDVDPLETWIEKYQPDAVVMAYSLQMLGGENYAFN